MIALLAIAALILGTPASAQQTKPKAKPAEAATADEEKQEKAAKRRAANQRKKADAEETGFLAVCRARSNHDVQLLLSTIPNDLDLNALIRPFDHCCNEVIELRNLDVVDCDNAVAFEHAGRFRSLSFFRRIDDHGRVTRSESEPLEQLARLRQSG